MRFLSFNKRSAKPRGFSMIELLVVIAILAILATAMVKVGQNVLVNAQTKNTKSTIRLLSDALEEYKEYQGGGGGDLFPREPEDPEQSGEPDFGNFLNALGGDGFDISDSVEGTHETFNAWDDADDLPNQDFELPKRRIAMASIEYMYYVLDNVPDCQKLLNRLPGSATANDDNDSVTLSGGQRKTLVEVNDAWGHPIWYKNQGQGNFPILRSAGPDGEFGTADDILSTEI